MKKLLPLILLLISLSAFSQNVGDVIITEIMIDPNSATEQDREWFEVYNTTSSPINLVGWTIVDNSSSSRNHLIASATPVIVPANNYAVLVYNDNVALNAGISNAIYRYGYTSSPAGSTSTGPPTWNNESTYSGTPPSSTTADGPGLIAPNGTLIDEIKYGFGYSGLPAWPAQGTAQSVGYQLYSNRLTSVLNDDALNWVAATNVYGTFNGSSYFGTPGAANFASNTVVLMPGDVIITEIMIDPSNPSENATEYFELYNTTSSDINLKNWVIVDESASSRNHQITIDLTIVANGYLLFAPTIDPSLNGGMLNVDYAYGFNSPPGGTPTPGMGTNFPRFNNEISIATGDQDGIILLSDSGAEIDRVVYDYGQNGINLPAPGTIQGRSIELGLSNFTRTANDVASSWALAVKTYGDGDKGTPGIANGFDRVYTFNNAWLNGDPSGVTNTLANIVVVNGSATLTSNTSVRDLQVNSGSSITVNATQLSLGGYLDANGTINVPTGALAFVSANPQFINGNGTINTEIFTLANTVGVTNNATVNLFGSLNAGAGTFTNAGTFNLKSNATKTAIVNTLDVASNLSGNFNVERFIPVTSSNPSSRAFRFLGSPVTSSSTLFDNWQNGGVFTVNRGTHITGAAGTPGVINTATGFDETTTGAPSLFKFSNNATQVWQSQASTNQPTDVLNTLDGYRLFIRGDRDPSRLTGVVNGNATTLVSNGELAQQNVTRSYTIDGEQFILVGNPYVAPVNMQNVLANSTNINTNVVYYWDPNLGGINGRGAYTTVSGFAGGGTATVLPASPNSVFLQPGQAAFVVTNAGVSDATIRFRESDKGTNTNLSTSPVFGTFTETGDAVSIELYDTPSFTQGSSLSDAIKLSFSNQAPARIKKLMNIDESMAIVKDASFLSLLQENLSIEAVSTYPLNITNYGENGYTFKINTSNFIGFDIVLKDKFLNTETPLQLNGVSIINFVIDQNNALSAAADRFELKFTPQTLSVDENDGVSSVKIYPNPAKGRFTIQHTQTDATITVINTLGQSVYSMKTSTLETDVNTSSWNSGVYFVNITSGTKTETLKLIVN